jgi:hypothetical protein
LEVGITGHNFGRGPSKDHSTKVGSYQVSVHLAEGFQRRRLKCEKLTDDRRRILHHLSQGFRQRAWWAPNKLCGLPKLIWWGPIWPLKYFLSFKPWHMSSSSKGNVSFCHRSVSIVCHPLTFHILIFSSETPQPNELKLGRKHL